MPRAARKRAVSVFTAARRSAAMVLPSMMVALIFPFMHCLWSSGPEPHRAFADRRRCASACRPPPRGDLDLTRRQPEFMSKEPAQRVIGLSLERRRAHTGLEHKLTVG